MKPFFRRKIFGISVILIVCTLFAYFITGFIYFPKEITLTEKTMHRFNFGLPLEATIEPETVSVLKVNNKPVDTNVKVRLQDTVTIESEETGTAQMTLNAFGLSLKKVTIDIMPEMEVIPCGLSIGVNINTDGILVLGTDFVKGEDGSAHKPCDGKIKSGDLIIDANGEELKNKESLIKIIEKSEDEVKLKIKRDEEVIETSVKPIKSADDKQNKIGIWVRDSTQGIGTITYYNPESGAFAALGHGILDVDTKKLMSIKDGKIMASTINNVKKGEKGAPGELVGEIQSSSIMGEVKSNSPYGIYGIADTSDASKFGSDKMKIGLQGQVHEGPAIIRSNVEKDRIEEFDVYIESVNRYSSDDTKGMIIRITDPELLQKTGGIVQGMSGSPIIQDGRLIGAVTHVFVQDPAKGYGIFIENMLKQEKKI